MIRLLFCSNARYGGHLSFTVHLMHALRHVGQAVSLHKPHHTTETKLRPFSYGEFYQNIDARSIKRAIKSGETVLITATNKPRAEDIDYALELGCRLVIHDPAEFNRGFDYTLAERPIVIRRSMLSHLDDAMYLPHPYSPYYTGQRSTGKRLGISVSRIDYDKNTTILLDANRLLPRRNRIHIYGFENRLYTKFKVKPEYPEWEQSIGDFPREFRYAVKLCHTARFLCDMSTIKGDGGGTQYTFLEAIDAGALPVLHRDWILPDGVMQDESVEPNCISVQDGEELAGVLDQYGRDTEFREFVEFELLKNAQELLKQHGLRRTGLMWQEELIDA